MTPECMIAPGLGMLLLTFICMLFTLYSRISAVQSRKLSIKYFTLFQAQGKEVPELVIKTGRHYANLFEVPMLFYFLIALSYSARLTDEILCGLCWGFVVFRVCHSFVHLSYNNVQHRLAAFFLANACLLMGWVRFSSLIF